MSVAERSALGVLLAATLATLLLVARNGLTPAQQPWTFGLVLWGWTALLYSAVGLAAVLLGLMAARYPPLRPLYRWLPAGAAVFVGAALLSNPRAVSSLFALEGPDRFRLLVPAAGTLAALAAVALAIPLARGRILIRTAALLALAGCLFALWPEGEARGARGRAAPIRLQSAPFALVGIDGADWTYMAPLMARGELPHFKAMMDRGAWGPLETLRPTLSPAIWTSIATGRRPRRHGVLGFTARRLRGVEQTLPELRTLSRLGFPFLLARLQAGGQILEAPISSFTRRVPAFWNIASAQGSPVSVINWWGTWPAEPVLGEIVSERAYYHELLYRGQGRRPDGLTSPEDLYAEIARRIVLPDEVTVADTRAFMDVTAEEFERMQVKHPSPLEGIAYEFTYFHSMFTTNRRLALDAVERSRRRYGRPADLFVLFRLVDKTSHTALVYSELVQDHEDASNDDIRRYRGVVSAAYRAVDDALGEIQQAFGEANVIVVSDHGFKLERGRGYNHTRAPAGIFLAAGPAFPPGRVEGLSVLDIMPLMLYLKGFPIAQDFEGRLPAEALRPALLASNPPRVIASYGRRGWPVKNAEGSAEIDAEMLERLRALGYLK